MGDITQTTMDSTCGLYVIYDGARLHEPTGDSELPPMVPVDHSVDRFSSFIFADNGFHHLAFYSEPQNL